VAMPNACYVNMVTSHHLVLVRAGVWDEGGALLAVTSGTAAAEVALRSGTAHDGAVQAVPQHHGEAALQHLCSAVTSAS
jgi:hypothetical protein